MEHWLSDAILLYSDRLKQYVKPTLYYKTFVANNTLNTLGYEHIRINKQGTISKYNITTYPTIVIDNFRYEGYKDTTTLGKIICGSFEEHPLC